jgi:small subunit ribosomal protein S8
MGRSVTISTEIPPPLSMIERLGISKARQNELMAISRATRERLRNERKAPEVSATAAIVAASPVKGGYRTDPVADFLARIRNAIRARHQKLDVPASKVKTEIARILKEEGYISNYKTQDEDGKAILRVYLKYGAGSEAAIRDLASVSRPGCRVYVGRDEIKRVQGGLGISIIATPKGVMTGRQALREGVDGEILCEVW